ncbi:MAG: TPM domain-containing protein, partial [Methylibium sp.]|nr:TPM domain-containing protein [Methylibium sp.]
IYLLLAEHAIEIVADRGLDRQAGTAQWQAIVAEMSAAFREGRFEDGLNTAIDHVDALLRRHFAVPASAANPNELPDAPALL